MTPNEIAQTLTQLTACCSAPEWTGQNVVSLRTTKAFRAIELLVKLKAAEIYATIESDNLQRRLDREESKDSIPEGTQINLQVPQNLNSLAIVEDVEGLLAIHGAITREPTAYIILPSNGIPILHLKDDSLEKLPQDFRNYHQTVELWNLLASKCHHFDASGENILFFGIRRLEIRPIAGIKDLKSQMNVAEIKGFCLSSDNEEIRNDIFVAELSELLKDISPSIAFRTLLRQNSKFARRLKEGLAIYLSTKTPVKLLEEARSSSLSLYEKIEKLVTGLELKSLAIPAAILLGVKDVEKGLGFTPINNILLGSTALFATTMVLVHISQLAMIEALKSSVERCQRDFSDRGLDTKNPDLEVSFETLIKRLSVAKKGSWIVVTLSFFPVIAIWISMNYAKPSTPKTTKITFEKLYSNNINY